MIHPLDGAIAKAHPSDTRSDTVPRIISELVDLDVLLGVEQLATSQCRRWG